MTDLLLQKVKNSDDEIRSETVVFDGMVRFVIVDKNYAKFCFGVNPSIDVHKLISVINEKFNVVPEHIDPYYEDLIFKKTWKIKPFGCNVMISLHHKYEGHVIYFTLPLSKIPLEKYMDGDYRFINVDEIMTFLTDAINYSENNRLSLEPKHGPSPLYRTDSSGIVFCGDNICGDWAMSVLRNPNYY